MSSESIFVAGHRGLVGSAIVRNLRTRGYERIIERTRAELDLTDPAAVAKFFDDTKPQLVVLAAARVGGIKANHQFPVEFLLSNLKIQNNVMESAHRCGVRKLLFLGSSCIYPKFAPQPIPESALMTGLLEPTNDAYALAKIAGIRLGRAYVEEYGANFISAMPTNLYGPGDNFDLQASHVLPALLRKMHEAKLAEAETVVVWGTGQPRREFLHVDDLAEACVFLLEKYDSPEIINVGYGDDISIREVAELIRAVVGFKGSLAFDTSSPDGTPRKLLDTTRITNLGWKPRISLRDGLQQTYRWFVENAGSRA